MRRAGEDMEPRAAPSASRVRPESVGMAGRCRKSKAGGSASAAGAHDIHPKDKLDVGKRMARWALADAYHRQITPSGPMLRAARLQGSKIIVTFTDAGKGLRLRHGDRLEEFAIAGADHEWHWASAEIVGKDRVEVRSQSVPHPVAVRYAFNSNPRNPNLTNDTGLPAAPFRTDDWPDPTDGRR